MKVVLQVVTLAILCFVGASYLDESRMSWGALPYMELETSATKASKWSGRAVDHKRETYWIAKDGRDDIWTATFEEPVALIGVSIDTSFYRSFGANLLRIRLIDPDGEVRTISRTKQTHIFSCWHVSRMEASYRTKSVEIEVPHIGREAGVNWALRDVRFLVDGKSELPESAKGRSLTEALREGVLPFGIGVLWLLFLAWRTKAGNSPNANHA